MQLWFWGWLVVAAAAGALAAVTRDKTAAPFAFGALGAAIVEAAFGQPAWEWSAFVGLSSVLFVMLNRRRYRPRHRHDAGGRHRRGHAAQHDEDAP